MISSGSENLVSRGSAFRPLKQCVLYSSLQAALSAAQQAGNPAAGEIPFSEWVGLMVYIPQGSPITSLSFYCCPRPNAAEDPNTPAMAAKPAQNWYQLMKPDGSGLPVTLAVGGGPAVNSQAGQCYDLGSVLSAAGVSGAGSLRITANAQGNVELSAKA